MLAHWPNIVAALGIVLIGWMTMWIIRIIIRKTCQKIPFHIISKKVGFTDFLKKAQVESSPSEIIGKFLGGYVFMMFFLAASNVLGLTDISEFLDKVIRYIPNIVVALFIVIIGSQFAQTTGAIVQSAAIFLKPGVAKILRLVATNIIILFSIITALFQLNIADELVKIMFIGVVASLSISIGLAVGLGSVDFIRDVLQHIIKEKTEKIASKSTQKKTHKA